MGLLSSEPVMIFYLQFIAGSFVMSIILQSQLSVKDTLAITLSSESGGHCVAFIN